MKCGMCDESLKRLEKSIGCNACKFKYHQQCSNLPENEFEIMLSTRTKLKWFCQLCESDVSEILTNFQKFKKVSKEISDIRDDMAGKLKEFEHRLVHCEVQKTSENVSQTIKEQVAKDYSITREEEKLIESKKCNLIFFKVPECPAENPGERMKKDYEVLNEAYNQKFAKNTDIDACFRVGKKTDSVRPLIVSFKNEEIKKTMLSQGRELSIKRNNEEIRIYSSIDRTQKQREQHKLLVETMKSRKENGEDNLGIKNGRIVENFQKIGGPTRVRWADLFIN